MKKLTIFTPTYNRAKYLKRLFDSIVNQKYVDQCEWIVIDDESTDDTEDIIQEIIDSTTVLQVSYVKQIHGGKHRAINRALEIAEGEYFFIVDSDDYLYTDAISTIFSWIDAIDSKNICAVAGLRIYPNGQSVGGNLSFSENTYIDASNFDRYRFNLAGDKAEVYRTDLLKAHKFPEFDGEFFVTESVCWNAIAADGYKIRWYNSPIYICDYLDDGLTKTGANEISGHIRNFRGYCYYIKQSLSLIPGISRFAYFVDYRNTVKEMQMSLKEQAQSLNIDRIQYLNLIIISSVYNFMKKLRNLVR